MFFVLTGRGPAAYHRLRRRDLTFRHLYRACRDAGVDMVLTTPENVDARTGKCKGWTLNEAQGANWNPKLCSLENRILYDAMYLSDLKMQRKAYHRALASARRSGCLVFNPKLPPKDELHRLLVDTARVDDRSSEPLHIVVPVSHLHVDVKQVKHLLHRTNGAMWLKPVYGSGGRNMLFIAPLGREQYRVRGARFFDADVSAQWSERELLKQVQKALRRREYLLQEDVDLIQTADGRRVDFRVTLARGTEGVWSVTAITSRYARPGNTLTNFHAGGSIRSLTALEESTVQALTEVGLTKRDLDRIVNCATQAAQKISREYPLVGLLGIDVGVSAVDGRTYVYDCNSRPGRDILTDPEIEETMRQVAKFARYLQERAKN
ncbi:YheC/YheD family protein [Alicyclobacillus fastidiosus]|uniref:YheC/YheD family protein n=1 Tax=Alicyclobacillus fastidiosus TaxID=392011 RepID=A0ABY6ZDA1_9BACL|nr:YheC/YheD family protein [Alicyclobacillus fastidiosus]WAH40817.1 YheC/YheD family protein [Alicyclobacillus fastidiosus]GMA62298.1 endospore coat-associated protein YheD [Alicyclobacillus fastidiosus]